MSGRLPDPISTRYQIMITEYRSRARHPLATWLGRKSSLIAGLNPGSREALHGPFPQAHRLSITLVVPSKLSARMVNYHNPITIAHEFGAYTLPSRSGPCRPTNWSVFSTAAVLKFLHVVNGIFMWVSQSCCATLQALLDYLTVTIRL